MRRSNSETSAFKSPDGGSKVESRGDRLMARESFTKKEEIRKKHC
jgi:hypothetical protein